MKEFRKLAFVIAATTVLAAAACGGDSSTGPSGPSNPASTPTGAYAITTINTKALPVAIFSDTGGGGYKWEVMSGTFTLTSDGKYSSVMTSRQTLSGKIDLFVDSTGGTWVLGGTTITFTNGQDGSVDHADWASAKLTFVETEGTASNTYVYTKK